MNDKQLKINVGCGDRKMYGYVNVDIREDVEPDVVCDVTQLSKSFRDADLVYACHVLEHFPDHGSKFAPITWKTVLQDWHKTLRPGGTLRLAVPDLDAVCRGYLEDLDLDKVKAFFFGGQKYDFDFHFHGWNFQTLKSDLRDLGFENVRLYDWKQTDHFYVDDYSQSYLPHMDKEHGTLMSLNVEATKI